MFGNFFAFFGRQGLKDAPRRITRSENTKHTNFFALGFPVF
jgi:hypothetical protein